MKQEKIKYKDIMSLGFTEEKQFDEVYFDEYGFDWCIIEKKLTSKIYLNWKKETQFCEIIRLGKGKDASIMKRKPIKNLDELKEVVDFFSDKDENTTTYTYMA